MYILIIYEIIIKNVHYFKEKKKIKQASPLYDTSIFVLLQILR